MPVAASRQIEMLRQMILIREFEEAVIRLRSAGKIYGVVHPYTGQEAIAVGVCATLTKSDRITSTHRGHGHCIAKGADLRRMMAELYARVDGYCKGKGGSMHIADVSKGMLGANAIVGGAAPLALGAALTAKVTKSGAVSVAFAGDGATNQGTTFEAMNMAVVLKLPVIFAIENNGYGEHTARDYAVGADLTERTRAFGIPAVKVDGTDFFAVHAAMAEAVERGRNGGGPSAIEAVAYRWHGHFEGDAQAYRDKAEIKRLRETADPLQIFRDRVLAEGALTVEVMDRIDAEVADCVEFALAAPEPKPEELTRYIWAED